MSLQRRLLVYLLVCAPLVWAVGLYASIDRARDEVNELFDAELIRLARQVQATLGPGEPPAATQLPRAPRKGEPGAGDADVGDLAIAVWTRDGRVVLSDREGDALPFLPDASGFRTEALAGQPWRVYYLQSPDGRWLVAAGQREYERDELVYGLTLSQLIPWLLVLPVLLGVMAWAVRRALAPMRHLADDIARRDAQDLRAIPGAQAPQELQPLVQAMNGLFSRIEAMVQRERRFTADAAHELRTPLAVLGAQWDVVRRAQAPLERREAEEKFGAGLERMSRLVTQMLALSRVESSAMRVASTEVAWPAIVERAMSDGLALAERRRIELACEWPPEGVHPMPLLGDADLLAVMLRNLLDNAIRYSPEGGSVVLRFARDALAVENGGEPLGAEQLARLGERFYRPDGQNESGSGLGISIAQRIAQLHGLALAFGTRDDGTGFRATVRFAPAPPAAAPESLSAP